MGVEATRDINLEELLPIVVGESLRNKILEMPPPNYKFVKLDNEIPKKDHEDDKVERWRALGSTYTPFEGIIPARGGVILIKIPLGFLKNAFNLFFREYTFCRNGVACSIPRDVINLFPDKGHFESNSAYRDTISEIEGIFRRRGINASLNSLTVNDEISVKIMSIVGEQLTAYMWRQHLEQVRCGCGASYYDLMLNGMTVDVKTKYRPRGGFKYFYQVTIPKYQEGNICDKYVAVYVLPEMEDAYIVGCTDQEYFKENGEFIAEGTTLWNNRSKTYSCDTVSLQFNEYPKWYEDFEVPFIESTCHPVVQKQIKNEN